MSTLSVNAITDASGGTTASINGHTPTASNMAGKNRIINGAMMIDQRNAGAAVTLGAGSLFPVDRFYAYNATSGATMTAQQSSTAPSGFAKSLLFTVSTGASVGASDYTQLRQAIEGFNTADLNYGLSTAKTITISFWVRSSVTGTYGLSLMEGGGSRSYMNSYTISSADTWQHITLTIPGDTGGSWNTTNGSSLMLCWDLGVGSSRSVSVTNAWQTASYKDGLTGGTKLIETTGATFYITGVQLEVGSTATEFEHRLYGQELALCQRYYEVLMKSDSGDANRPAAVAATTTDIYFNILYKVNKRTSSPTVTFTAGEIYNSGWSAFTSPVATGANDVSAQLTGIKSGLTQNAAYLVRNAAITVSAEL